jgi:transposase-like protein
MSTQFSECPKCGSNQLEYGDFDGDYGWVSQRITCTGCEFEWDEVYKFTYNWDVQNEKEI